MISDLIRRIAEIDRTRGDGCNQLSDVRRRCASAELADQLRDLFGCCGNRREVVAECTGEHGERWTVREVYCQHTGRICMAAKMGARTPSQEELIELVSFIERAK